MSRINVLNVEVKNNPAQFTDEFVFDITFECLPPGIKHELEWKLVYVGSAKSESYDQHLESVLVGPVSIGKNKFTFTAPPPNPALIPAQDLVDVTAMILTCSYCDHEFIRVGYYVNTYMPGQDPAPAAPGVDLGNDEDEDMAMEDADVDMAEESASAAAANRAPVDVRKLLRNVLTKPRVRRFTIPWDQLDGNASSAMMALENSNSNDVEMAG